MTKDRCPITVVILTLNEELHISRCLNSVMAFADNVLVVDSGSTDNTVDLARSFGAEVIYNPWVNYAKQFNWALERIADRCGWVMRLDADEVVSEELSDEIVTNFSNLSDGVDGVYVPRRMTFLKRPIRWGGVFPVRVLRLFRNTRGYCENRWMDEHIVVSGNTINFHGEIVDDNRNSLTWWTAKHNAYASREVIDLLNLEYGFMRHETVADLRQGNQAGVKRWVKENLYARLPGGIRAFIYFLYRYVIRLGFLDGREGAAFHVLQGFWYRYLVDMKIAEVKSRMKTDGVDVTTAIRDVLGIDPGL